MSSKASGLAFLCDGTGPVARQGDRMIPRDVFLAEIKELAQLLPDCPYLINFCTDRYRFTVAWAAAMVRGQITLLPGGQNAAAVASVQADYPALYVLTDDHKTDDHKTDDHKTGDFTPYDDTKDGGGQTLRFAYPTLLGHVGSGCVPAFPADQIAAVLFTSGSTGRPNPSPRRWGRIVASTIAAGAVLGIEQHKGAAVVATVPHAHSYGLESAVMLPLQHGLLLTAERPFFPADVAAALGGSRPGVLVTTPVHLRALAGDAAAGDPGPGFGASVHAGLVLSATAPLSAQLAARAEATFSAPLFEIFGCSEAGQLATRRTTQGHAWRCLDGFRLRHDADGTWASGPVEEDALLADAFELINDQDFILLGRTADMVNIAGKRSSLGYLTAQLTALDGVEDGIFLLPDESTASVPARLAAVVVAPGRDAAMIFSALRGKIDPAFLPRPLHVVDKLPRNALGKLTRGELLQLLNAGKPSPVILRFPADHPAGPGHFPGNPIVPGAVLLDTIVAALFPDGWFGEVEAAKFHYPVRPGDTVAASYTADAGVIRFECRLAGSEHLVLSGALRSAFPSR